MDNLIDFGPVLEALIFSMIGLVAFGVSILLFDKLTPFKIWDEVIHKQNSALATIVAAVIIGVALIIGLAHG